MASHMKSPDVMSAETPTKNPKKSRWLWAIPVVLIAILAGAYLGGYAYFQGKFLPNTTLDGTAVYGLDPADVAAQKSSELDDYSVSIQGQGLDLTITGEEAGLAYDGEAYVAEAMSEQNYWAWPLSFANEQQLTATASMSYDHDAVVSLVEGAQAADGGQASYAETVTFDAETGSYVVDEAVLNSLVDSEKVADAYFKAAQAGETSVTVDSSYLTGGSELTACAAAANTYVASAGVLTLNGITAYELTAEKIAGWVQIADDGTVSLNTDAIAEFCHGELTDLLDTYGKARTYTRPDGKVCTVEDGNNSYGTSTYGWVTDGDACATAIAEALAAGTPCSVELPCKLSAAQPVTVDGKDWGNRYIDVDLAEQHARFYGDDGSLIWEADITTGQPVVTNDDGTTSDHSTPTGVWVTTNKKDGDVNLKGPIDPETGEPEWDSHVNFWVGVVGNLVGFHNAPWQESMGFGGTIYTWYGSHGCIRMSYASAEKLYSLVNVGDVVVIHN